MESSFDKLRMNVSWFDKLVLSKAEGLTMDTFILSLSKDERRQN